MKCKNCGLPIEPDEGMPGKYIHSLQGPRPNPFAPKVQLEMTARSCRWARYLAGITKSITDRRVAGHAEPAIDEQLGLTL